MAIRYKKADLSASEKKKLSAFMGFSEPWTRIRISLTGTSRIGDSTIDGTATPGIVISGGVFTFEFGCASNPAEELYLLGDSAGSTTLEIFAT